jgi:predicted amidohydrolase
MMSTVARVVTTCQNGYRGATIEENRDYMLGILDRALRLKPDIVCLPEACTTTDVPAPKGSKVTDKFPGPTTDAVAQRAKQHRCYIICPIEIEREGKARNSAIVFDRAGDILGIYDKIHPVTTAHDYSVFEDGATPGEGPVLFDLDCGRIGIQICFDIGFPETWAALARKRAKLVFWPSAYNGGFPLQAYACTHQYYVVTSVRTDKSRIINPCGRVVAETDALVNMAAYDLNLDFAVCHYDFNYAIPDRIMDTYGDRVRVVSYKDDGYFLVEPMERELSMKQLQEEFGFEVAKTYYDRHREGYRSIKAGERPAPQKARHGDRPQYGKT